MTSYTHNLYSYFGSTCVSCCCCRFRFLIKRVKENNRAWNGRSASRPPSLFSISLIAWSTVIGRENRIKSLFVRWRQIYFHRPLDVKEEKEDGRKPIMVLHIFEVNRGQVATLSWCYHGVIDFFLTLSLHPLKFSLRFFIPSQIKITAHRHW